MKQISRRSFQKTAAAASTAIPLFSIGKAGQSANSKVNVAMIGAGHIASVAYGGVQNENIVALCDVDSSMIDKNLGKHPDNPSAKQFSDFRRMLDKMDKDIDMVCVNTPDHTHFPATMAAMERGINVFTQKPLCHDIWQARTLKKAKAKYNVLTNMGNQGHTYNGIRQLKEWYDFGIFGQITEVHSYIDGPEWGGRYFERPDSLPPAKDPIPRNLDWDLWQGPTGPTDFSRLYAPEKWRAFNRYGTGTFGDWFCHVADAPVWLLDLYEPVAVEAEKVEGGNEWMVADGCRVRFDFERRGDKAPCTFYWYNGDPELFRPEAPEDWSWPGKMPKSGTFYYGTKNNGYTDNRSNNPRLANKEAAIAFKKDGYLDEVYPRIKGGPILELVNAIKGGAEPGSNFDYAAPFTEVMLLGIIAVNHGGKIEWDSKNIKITNRPELNQYRKDPVRSGWEYGENLWR
ncbi:Gfo/Idh/MocA family oxidoreductase [Pontiellaceae bacterium B1224]|nr:Gfo/Idh/MocA family oxidoreductase [Pontiellaceae bacterium B1224]